MNEQRDSELDTIRLERLDKINELTAQRDAAVAALRDELDALNVWRLDKALSNDIAQGVAISRDKITRAIAAAEKGAQL